MVMSVFIAFLLSISWTIVALTQTTTLTNDLSLKGKTNKENFILGEPVTVEFEFINEGDDSVKVAGSGVESGGLKIFIAQGQDREYKEYFIGDWGRKHGQYISLEPKQLHRFKGATILWNGKPNVSHLNETAAARVLKGKITTEYAFPEPGVYFIKGLSYFGENATPIESEPIKVVIEEPVGDDLDVWNQIKGNKEIAYLMQHSAFDTGKEAKKEQLNNQVEQIFVQYPNSIYSSYLKSNLEKYKARQKVLKESLEKAIIKPKN